MIQCLRNSSLPHLKKSAVRNSPTSIKYPMIFPAHTSQMIVCLCLVVKWTHYDCIVGEDNHARPLPPSFCRPWSIIFSAVFQEDVVFKTNKPRCGDRYKEDDDEVEMRWSSQGPQCCMIIHVAVYIYVYIYIHIHILLMFQKSRTTWNV